MQCETCKHARFEQVAPASKMDINGQEVETPPQIRTWCLVSDTCYTLIDPSDDFYCEEYCKKGEQEND